MGVVLVGKNVNAQAFSMGINVPVMDGLLGVWFGGSQGGWYNQISGGVQPSIVGTPTSTTEYSSQMSTTSYVDTGIAEQANMTMLVVGKVYAPTSSRMQFFGNYNQNTTDSGTSITANGAGIVFEAAGTQEMVGSSYTGVAGASSNPNIAILTAESGLATSLSAAGDSSWRAMLGKIDGLGAAGTAGNRYIKNLTKGTSVSTALVSGNVRDLRNTATLRIGTQGPNGNATAATEIMLAMLWNRALTNAEEAQMYAYIKSYASRRGITV
nr:hypothetical protein [Pantoea cypripedii]